MDYPRLCIRVCSFFFFYLQSIAILFAEDGGSHNWISWVSIFVFLISLFLCSRLLKNILLISSCFDISWVKQSQLWCLKTLAWSLTIAESSMKLLYLLKRKKEILMMSLITWVTLVVSQVLHYQNEISLFCLTDDPRPVTLTSFCVFNFINH